MDQLDKFICIFSGLETAYGTYRVESQNAKGKSVGKAIVVRQPPTKDLWQKHFDGVEPSLGIIPIRADNSCIWGCIDIDTYPLDLEALVQKIQKLKLPLVCCRSKSGGAHVFAFTKDPVPAGEMQDYLTGCAALMGESGREIFPKQREVLVSRGDTGNFLNLCYHNSERTVRYAIKGDGSAASLNEFFEMYEAHVQEKLVLPKVPAKADAPASDGPPCLQALCSQGFPEGSRNNGMFSLGLYLKKAFPQAWESKLLEYNQNTLIRLLVCKSWASFKSN